jgi:hypothetical protein
LRYKAEVSRLNGILSKTGQLEFDFKSENEEEYKDKIRKRLNRLSDRLEELENETWS